jgi:putative transcriptional regulator
MASKRKYRSKVAEAVHEGVRGMHRLGLVDKKTMREFDVRCFTAVDDLSAKDIQALRERAGVSQSIMAKCLNVTTNYVSQLERGAKRPRGATLKLLCLVRSKGLEAIMWDGTADHGAASPAKVTLWYFLEKN